jgi:hypothetical protein
MQPASSSTVGRDRGGPGTVGAVTAYRFLSERWIEEARALRARYEHQLPPPRAPVKLNVVVTGIPHRSGELQGHIDSSDGQMLIEDGHLADADATITVDYETARAAFVTQDQAKVMQAFLGGRIFLEGDASKLLALQVGQASPDPLTIEIYEQLRAFTADD